MTLSEMYLNLNINCYYRSGKHLGILDQLGIVTALYYIILIALCVVMISFGRT